MSRAQRNLNAYRRHTPQVRHILLHGNRYDKVDHVPAVKVSTGNADPTR